MNCCKKPKTSDLSYSTFVFPEPDGRPVVERRTHVYCHTCGAHEYGRLGSEPRIITEAEWEAGLVGVLRN